MKFKEYLEEVKEINPKEAKEIRNFFDENTPYYNQITKIIDNTHKAIIKWAKAKKNTLKKYVMKDIGNFFEKGGTINSIGGYGEVGIDTRAAAILATLVRASKGKLGDLGKRNVGIGYESSVMRLYLEAINNKDFKTFYGNNGIIPFIERTFTGLVLKSKLSFSDFEKNMTDKIIAYLEKETEI